MTWWIWILAFLVTVLEPWPVTVEGISGFGWEPVTFGGIRGVIVPARDAGSLVHGTRPELSEGDYLTPVLAEIEAAEAAIAAEQGGLDHLRQYAGFIENGDRKVYINGFCDALGINWTSERVLVDDGGDCYFTAIYNIEQAELEMFRFNGEG